MYLSIGPVRLTLSRRGVVFDVTPWVHVSTSRKHLTFDVGRLRMNVYVSAYIERRNDPDVTLGSFMQAHPVEITLDR